MTLYRRQGSRNAKKAKWLSEEALQIPRREEEKPKAKEKRKDIPI